MIRYRLGEARLSLRVLADHGGDAVAQFQRLALVVAKVGEFDAVDDHTTTALRDAAASAGRDTCRNQRAG